MADSKTTKRALANSLKAQMETEPFSKITVGEICSRCDMNRKSFYYHFKDKLDLIYWIYLTEVNAITIGKTYANIWDFLEDICGIVWKDRKFYRQVFQIKGQNSLCEGMAEMLKPALKNAGALADEFCVEFLADSLICAIEKWICGKDPTNPADFVAKIKDCVVQAKKIV